MRALLAVSRRLRKGPAKGPRERSRRAVVRATVRPAAAGDRRRLMFETFEVRDWRTPGATIHGRIGGKGPPLLLLHGNPLTHVMWHKIAPRLAEHYTVIASDLRGYGDSSKPAGGGDHDAYSFRTMANDQVAVMKHFGHDKWFVAGHDRGGR